MFKPAILQASLKGDSMCGLVGIFSPNGIISEHKLEAGNAAIRHRGPDEEGVWINETKTCGLGHVRLSIIDIAGGKQPLSSPDGSIQAIVNGEFYGFEKIRDEYTRKGYEFKTLSDSEILIPLYLQHGENCLEFLRGEFSFVLWDARKQQLFLARDRFGIKPLFYARHQDTFYFGSEVKALLAMGVPAHWDPVTVQDEEYDHRNCEDTLFRDVKNVLPGCFMLVTGNNISSHKYWDFNYPLQGELPTKYNEQNYIDEFWNLLTEAVKLRLRADVPVGVYLSGGIDSSVVLSLMGGHAHNTLDAFTISFDDGLYDEGDIAREMAAYAGVRHSVIDVSSRDLAPELENTIWHNECPSTNSNTIAKYILSRHVRNAGLKVVLTGEGSDEVLGGYPFFMGDMRLHNSHALGPTMANNLRRLRQFTSRIKNAGGNRKGRVTANLPDFSKVVERMGYIPRQLKWMSGAGSRYGKLRTDDFINTKSNDILFESLMNSLDESQISGRDPLNKSLYLWGKSGLPNMILTTLGDRVEMAHSIEARLPFLDHKVVEFLTRLPVELKIKVNMRGGIEKYLLKEAAKGHVTDTLYKRTKHSFAAPPTERAAKDPMSEIIADTLHGQDMRNLDLYDQDKVLKSYNKSKSHPDAVIGSTLLRITGLAIMQRKFGLTL